MPLYWTPTGKAQSKGRWQAARDRDQQARQTAADATTRLDALEKSFGELETARGRYLVLHGDVFDGVVKNMVFLAHLGDIGYAMLLRLNRAYNWWRQLRGKEYFSLSKAIKARVKQAVSFVGKFEDQVVGLAKARGYAGVICGHIHTPADKMIGGVHYLNSGDWVESLTALVEHFDGRWELIEFDRFRQLFPYRAPENESAAFAELDDDTELAETNAA